MNEVKNLSITELNNGNFYQFIENVVAIVSNEPIAAGVIQPLAIKVPILINSYKKELLTIETQQIVVLDFKRDRAFLKVKYIAEGYAFDDEKPINKEASEKLQTFINQHGAGQLIKFDYHKETASITSFVADVQTHASAALAQLGLNGALTFLETSNNKFKEFYASRGDAASVLANVPPFYKLRKEVTKQYRTFANDLESLQRFTPASAAQVADLITRVNIEIDKFRLLVPTTPAPPAP